MSEQEFFTFQEYLRKEQEYLSPSAEDYLEMIYRVSEVKGFTRVNDIAQALNVQPPSVSKMIHKLSRMGLVKYEKYGVIMLEESGKNVGKALLRRHNILESFLRLLNVKDGLLKETEKIEHTINDEILKGLFDLVNFFDQFPDYLDQFNQFRSEHK